MNAIAGFLSFGFAVVLAALVDHCAFKRGYAKGHQDAEEWIVTLETEVDQARQEIWREGK